MGHAPGPGSKPPLWGPEAGRPHREAHRGRRGACTAWGLLRGLEGHGLGRGAEGVINVIKDRSVKYTEKTEIEEIPKSHGLTL